MPKWSPAQLEAIETVGKNIVVSASAGSGKTAVLTARMVKRIVRDHIGVEHLLAMTFTDAAASEMKNRLYAGLDEAGRQASDPALKHYCEEQCALLSSAMICTIHSFCLTVIKENYFVIGLSPNQIDRIFSEDEMLMMKQKIMKQTLRGLFQEDSARFNLAATHFSGRADDNKALQATIEKIADTALNQPDPEPFFKMILARYRQPVHFEDIDPDLLYYLKLKITTELSQLKNLLDEMIQLCQRLELQEETTSAVILKAGKLEAASQAIQNNDYPQFVRALRNAGQSALKNDKDEAYKALRKEINTQFQTLCAEYFDSDTLFYDNVRLLPIAEFLVEGARLFLTLLQKEKKEKEGLDFSDMEHLAYAILSANQGAVAQKYRDRFDEILVDEFQDTNEFQNAMIEMISRGNNIFRVGDIKQSIYRFRGAKPSIMAALMKQKEQGQHSIILHHNYRSNRSIVDFNNLLFSRLMNIPGLNNEFTEDDQAAIGTPDQNDQYRWPVQFLKITANQEKKEERIKAINPKARILAQKILDMKNTTEFTHWRDYCVLVRSHAIKDEIRFVFESMNIPYTTTLKSGFYKSYSLRILTAWLQLLANLQNDIAAISVLTGTYHYSDEQCAALQLTRQGKSFGAAASEQDKSFHQDYCDLQKTARQEGLTALLEKILQINDFYWDSLDNQERANVDLLMAKAAQAENNGMRLDAFLEQIEACLDQPSSTAVSASRSDDVVQITTIHQSKGLQYPVVFVWLSSKTVLNDELTPCMVDPVLGLGLHHIELPYRYQRPTYQRMAIAMKNALEEYEENVRLLYVALTRAQKVSILLDTVKEETPLRPLSLATFFENKGLSDLVLSALGDCCSSVYEALPISEEYRSLFHAEKLEQPQVSLPRYPLRCKTTYRLETPSSQEEKELRPLSYRPAAAAQRGTDLHKLIERLPLAPWNETMIRQAAPGCSSAELNALLKLGNNDLYLALCRQEVHKEFSFAARFEDRISHGMIDFLAISKQTYTLVDYKTDRHVSEEELIERYQGQLDRYAELLQVLYPDKQGNKLIYSFSLGKFIAVP